MHFRSATFGTKSQLFLLHFLPFFSQNSLKKINHQTFYLFVLTCNCFVYVLLLFLIIIEDIQEAFNFKGAKFGVIILGEFWEKYGVLHVILTNLFCSSLITS